MADSAALVCANHSAEAAVARCTKCGKPICGECRVEDVAADESFCSRECREARRRLSGGGLSDAELIEAFQSPIRNGWRLWGRSLGRLSFYTAPLALAMGAVADRTAADSQGTVSTAGAVALLVGFAFGIALTQIILTQRYSGLASGNPYALTAQRFVPWVLTIALMSTAVLLGYVALIIPGVYVGLRLFWADEFALVHRAGPVRAIRESWELTRDSAGTIFGFRFQAGLAAYGVILVVAFASVGVGALVEMASLAARLDTVETAFTFWAIFLGYGGLHAPEIVYLYGMRAEHAGVERSVLGLR